MKGLVRAVKPGGWRSTESTSRRSAAGSPASRRSTWASATGPAGPTTPAAESTAHTAFNETGGNEHCSGTCGYFLQQGLVRFQHGFEILRVGCLKLVHPLLQHVLALIPVALLIAGVGGAFLTNRMIQPVRQMTRTAEQVSAEDLSGRLPIQGNDEFADLASTFNKMMGRLQEAFTHLKLLIEQQRRFTADASHELRTPLTVIKAKTSLTLRGDRSPEEYRQALDSIDRAADTMNRLVQDLLLLARSDTGQLGLNLTPITVQDVLEPAAEIVQKPGSATITLNMPDAPVKVCGDLHALIRLFTNLMENALQHTPPGGKVIIDVESGEEMVSISVRDMGDGIPPEHLPHVFERFYRADASRTRTSGGTGLGLAICKSIAEAHHGTISIDSTLGEGTLVKVMLPLDIPDFS